MAAHLCSTEPGSDRLPIAVVLPQNDSYSPCGLTPPVARRRSWSPADAYGRRDRR